MMSDSFFGSICLSDIPRDLIQTGKNGKKYLNVVINRRREAGQYGHTHYIKAYVKRGEPLPQGATLYIGELKPSSRESSQQAQGNQKRPMVPTPAKDDDLPF